LAGWLVAALNPVAPGLVPSGSRVITRGQITEAEQNNLYSIASVGDALLAEPSEYLWSKVERNTCFIAQHPSTMARTRVPGTARGCPAGRPGRTSGEPAKGALGCPGVNFEKYRDRLLALNERIERDGPFVSHAERSLIEAKKVP
jgi:hypothetical protein